MFTTSVVGMIILLGGLIFFHELGHYSIAKLFKVKVEVFSLGFGKKLISKQWGETEYAISLFPLGGYVKLFGDDPTKEVPVELRGRAFITQALYKRFLIVAAGPVANFILAFVLLAIVFRLGQTFPATKVGHVTLNSPAWTAGFRAGDRIKTVDGETVTTWNEMEEKLKPKAGRTVNFDLVRNNAEMKLPVMLGKVTAKNAYGEDEEVGGIKGFVPYPMANMIGVSDPKSIAAKAEIHTGDIVTHVAGKEVNSFPSMNDALKANWAAGKSIELTIRRIEGDKETTVKPQILMPSGKVDEKANFFPANTLGIYPAELFVREVSPKSPAAEVGLKSGDRVIRVGNTNVLFFEQVVDTVQELGTKNTEIDLVVERAGEEKLLRPKPMQSTSTDPITQETVKKYLIGFAPTLPYLEAEPVKVQTRQIGALLSKTVTETFGLTEKMVVSLAKLAMGKISMKHLSGPVFIASVAGKSLSAGVSPFLHIMALISLNLFLLNLFPIPVLDGGHLLFFAIEALKGKPVSLKTMEVANQVGIVFILMLVGLTLFNDITRLIRH